MRKGDSVTAVREIKGGWGSPSVKAGSRGMIVKDSMWSSTYTVTFTDQGWGGKSVTVDGVKEADLRRS